MAGTVVDTSVLIELLAGATIEELEDALARSAVVIPPLVVVELVSGAAGLFERRAIGEILQDAPIHETPLDHWIRVGDLRRSLARKGVSVTVPDAHVAQCALDRDATLLATDHVFALIASHTVLRLSR